MILNRHNVFAYLVSRGQVSTTQALDGRVEIQDRSGRNRSFQVAFREGDGCFVKQGGLEVSAGGRHPEREAACFAMAEDWPELREVLPSLITTDQRERVVVMELVSGDNLLRSQSIAREFDSEYAACLGGALGALAHSSVARNGQLDDAPVFPAAVPWILNENWPDRQLKHGKPSGGQAAIVGIVREYPEVMEETVKIAAEWSANGLIHGDMKLENCLRRSIVSPRSPVVIVDWEFADHGDALWDVGGVIQSYFNQWLHSVRPTGAEDSLAEAVRSAEMSMSSMRAALRAFWTAYSRSAAMTGVDESGSLEKAIRYSGARLIQTAFEWAAGRAQLNWHAVRQVQAGVNLMSKPEGAKAQLLGKDGE